LRKKPKDFTLYFEPKFQQTYLLCRVAPRPCTPGILSVKEKVKLRLTTKDTPKTLDIWISRNLIIGESSLSRFSGAMTAKFVFQ